MDEPTRPELDEQAEAAGLDPGDYRTKEDLQEGLDAVNPRPAPPDDDDTTGRPPLAEVAEELAADRNVRSLPAREEA